MANSGKYKQQISSLQITVNLKVSLLGKSGSNGDEKWILVTLMHKNKQGLFVGQ